MTEQTAERQRRAAAIDAAYRAGDLEALRAVLGDPPGFPNCRHPHALGVGDRPLEYAIYWSPLGFIERLLDLGADPNHDDEAGFPSLIAALSSGREDGHEVLALLLAKGAAVTQRGLNDWTPLHFAVAQRDLAAVRLLLDHGADPTLATRIDDCRSALQDAEALGFTEAAALMREVSARRPALPR